MNQNIGRNVLVVDDDLLMLESVSLMLGEYGYIVTSCDSAAKAMDFIIEEKFDVVLTDIKMPETTGVELLKSIHAHNPFLPVILMTAYAELNVAINAVKEGAFDFINKPFRPEYLLFTINRAIDYYRLIQLEKNYKHLLEDTVKQRTGELESALANIDDLNKEIIIRLTAVAEFRDTDTGHHIRRIGLYSKMIAKELNMPEEFIRTIVDASSLHDIGKIGIKDRILLKPDMLTPEEFNIMKLHTTIGKKMLSGSSHALLKMATTIASTHHEKWDGSGYPEGLKGEKIPIEGRITIICDQYDALRSRRPYKKPFSHEEACKIITDGDMRTSPHHFDPDVIKVFKKVTPELKKIYDEAADPYKTE